MFLLFITILIDGIPHTRDVEAIISFSFSGLGLLFSSILSPYLLDKSLSLDTISSWPHKVSCK